MTKAADFVTLPKTRFLYLALALFAVLLVAGIVVVLSSGYANASCLESAMPAYEKQFGFRFGALSDRDVNGTLRLTNGIVWVDPSGAFGRAGLRVGDVPRMYHGVADFCGDLAAIADGHARQLSVRNVNDPGGQRRNVEIALR